MLSFDEGENTEMNGFYVDRVFFAIHEYAWVSTTEIQVRLIRIGYVGGELKSAYYNWKKKKN